MLGLKLREEFSGHRIKGTMIEMHNRNGTGALDKSASEFLKITYPSIDMLKTIEAVQAGRAEPVVIIGARGQGKSHLMAALSHMHQDQDATVNWLNDWAARLNNPAIASLKLQYGMHVITESLHLQRYKHVWDVLFKQHPHGEIIKAKWEVYGTEVPGYDLMLEMAENKPFILILDEFQTWFEGLTNSSQHKRKTWAFNFIQILSEISEKHPELLTLVVSVREGNSDAAQQLFRVNPVRIDFKGPEAKRDRQRLLLYRIFENRMNIPESDIAVLIQTHVDEFLRLSHISGSEHEKHRRQFIEAWPYSPRLLQLLDDQVLIATETQETRDLLRILVDVFKASGDDTAILTPAHFSLTSEKSGVTSLLDSVASQLHRDLRENALRNLEAVKNGVPAAQVPHLEAILSALWLRSMSLENHAGAEPSELQLDITERKAIDDNLFAAELAIIEDNSFNIHRQANRLVFKNEVNPQAKLLAHAKNDKLFQNDQDVEHLAKEIRYALVGDGNQSNNYRTIVLKKQWQTAPWSDVEEKDRPQYWDNRIPVVVMPKASLDNKELGEWLKTHVTKARNTVRFLLPRVGTADIFYDKSLLILARAVYLASDWKNSEREYVQLHLKYQKELREQLQSRFDRFAVLVVWNFADPAQCEFEISQHGAEGLQILEKLDEKIRNELFIPEEFDSMLLNAATNSRSVADLIEQLKEPASKGAESIPWLGETAIKARIGRACAEGKIAINAKGSLYEKKPSESVEDAWYRVRGKLGSGKDLEETTLHLPGGSVGSGGSVPVQRVPEELGDLTGGGNEPLPGNGGPMPSNTPNPSSLFGSSAGSVAHHSAQNTSTLSLLGKLEQWGINKFSKVKEVKLSTSQLTGAQLEHLLKNLPDGVTYSLDLDKEQ
ncbi:DUF499 domain-containing protein [Acinetobacter sp. SWAC57]|uniref:DUF499 domain-containing protein n=1 Tax=Acinetobacter sp. SWAC57 TaxID=2293834 RepID=UPI000E5BCBBE|nr:DUF499 domain-containing protein [Acinetobacter sp. SWAC57]RGD92570.1 hypothetical protein DYI96_04380 [Acinetobacter sp. SWAC57]